MTVRIQLRQAHADDADLVYDVTKTTMRSYVEQTFGAWNEPFQRKVIGDSFAPATHEIILVDGSVAGVQSALVHDDHVQLEKLFIMPSFQGRGVGSHLLRELARAAAAQRKPIRLRVLAVNTGARRFYERFGFVISEITPERVFMEYRT